MMRARVRRIFVVLVGLSSALCAGAGVAVASSGTEELVIRGAGGEHRFEVEIADNEKARAQGLMYRTTLASDKGMIFLLAHNRRVAMWMKNTPLSLDMIFIDASGRIAAIVDRTTPNSTDLIASPGPVRAVLEIRGGEAARRGLAPGDCVHFREFSCGALP
ncbi:MAG: DUF192 domain-containing protein [Alphaproteobacteria bacterium]